MRCPSCEADVQMGARFCPQCATPMPSTDSAPADPLRAALEAAIGFQYKIVRLLGRGGMGAVYLAHELALDRDVAIKVLPPERGESEEGRERFRREARIAARLNHTSIVPLQTFGEVRGIVYYVMAYVRGEPLSAKLRRDGRLPPEDTRRLLSEMADALEYAHGQGVVHRDLKPDNVLVEEGSGRAMLTDFGIAKALGSGHTLTATGAVVGTPHYMSPEQAAGKGDVDGRTDLYSLGVMGYAMLAGRLPFEGKTAGEILVQHMTKEPPPLAPLAAGAPEALVKAVMRCLFKDPASRWPDAKALRQALTPEEESELPESLRVVKAAAQVSFLGLLLVTPYWMQYWIERWVSGKTDFWAFFGDVARAIPFAVAVFLPLTALAARREGHSWSAIFHNALLQPTWWRSWYPRPFRRPGDVWERLPGPVRHLRLLGAAFLLWSGFVLSPVVIYMEAAVREYERWGAPRVHPLRDDFWKLTSGGSFLVTVGLFTLMAIQIARAWNRLRKQAAGALALDEVWQVLVASTADRRLWSRPAVAGVLELPSLRVGMPEPATGEKVEQALMRLADQVPTAHQQVVQRARHVARFARQSLASLDEELRALEQDFDAAEATRLDGKLVALGEPRPDEPAERRKMRELLAGQVELMRGLESRIEAGKREHARRIEQIKAVWRQAEALRVSTPDRSAESAAVLAALCDEIERGPAAAFASTTRAGGVSDVAELPTLDR